MRRRTKRDLVENVPMHDKKTQKKGHDDTKLSSIKTHFVYTKID